MNSPEMSSQSHISELLRAPFCAVVEEIHSIPGEQPNSIRGTVLVVKVTAGVGKVGGKISVSSRPSLELVVNAIERDLAMVNEAFLTERVGLLFRSVDLSTVKAGELVVAKP